MPTVKTEENVFSYDTQEVPSFCGGVRFFYLHDVSQYYYSRANAAKVQTLLSSVLAYLVRCRVASGFISDTVGGLWHTHLFRDVFTAEQLDTGCTITKDGSTYVLSPPYMNANSGNMVQSLIIIIPLQYRSEEEEEDDDEEDY